jgi:hypothetical protein
MRESLVVMLGLGMAVVLYRGVGVVQRACLSRARRHRRYADWYAVAARGSRRLADDYARRAETSTSARTQAFYRIMSKKLTRDAARHEIESRRHGLRTRFWDLLA